jgi:peptidoglycan lytic transglycosylase
MIIFWGRLRLSAAIGMLFSFMLPGCSGMLRRTELPSPPTPTEGGTPIPPPVQPQAQEEPAQPKGQKIQQVGEASWYGPDQQGKETASGEAFNQQELTAAHPTLPLGTKAIVTNLETGKSVQVKINDRGPYVKGRKIDLSRAAAKKIGVNKKGVAKVKIVATVPRKAEKRFVQKQTSGSFQEDGKTTQQRLSPE